nr:putative ribonuclease H-like domain-containing protein [Tanacetum cinerariifolium]
NFAPIAVLTKSGIVPISTARQSSSRVAAQLVLSGKNVTSAIGKQRSNVVKSSACWVWRPIIKGDPQAALRDTRIFILHMDLFEPTFIKSIMGKMYCLVVTDDYSRFSWVFFLAKNDETYGILKDFITGIENQLNHKVKIIRCDNRTEFKNHEMNQLCGIKRIKREFSNVRNQQQNGVTKRENMTLIEASRTMLADSLLPIPFWAEAVNTTCYVQNSVLVTKPHNKTPYELLIGRPPIISFMRPFGCPVTILNTLDYLGNFDGKADEGFLVGYSLNRQEGKEKVFNQEYILLLVLNTSSDVPSSNKEVESSPKDDVGKNPTVNIASDKDGTFQRTYGEWNFLTPIPVNAAGSSFSHPAALDDFSKMPNLEDNGIFDDAYDDRDEGAEANYNNL